MRPDRAALALAGLVAGEAAALAALAAGPWPAALGLHALCCAAPLIARGSPEGRAGQVLRATWPLLPALGPIAALGAIAALLLPRPKAMPEDPFEARLAAVAAARRLPEGLVVEALGDVLRWGTPAQRERARALLAVDPRPAPSALLRAARP
jgi:hypothetical protein